MNEQLMRFRTAFVKEDEMWCVPKNLNRLFKINLNNWIVSNVCDLGGDEEYFIDFILKYQECVWCISSIGANIIKYNMMTNEIERFEMKVGIRRNIEVILYNKKIWLIPIEISAQMVCFDLEKKEFSICDGWKKGCKDEGRLMPGCIMDGILYMVMLDQCKIVCFDLQKEKIKIEKIPNQFRLHSIFEFKNKLYLLLNKERKLICWNEKTGEIKMFEDLALGNKPYDYGFGFEDGILLTDSEKMDFFNVKSEKTHEYDVIKIELEHINGCIHFFFGNLVYGERIFLLPWNGDLLLEYNRISRKWKSHVLKIPEDIFYKHYVYKRLQKGQLITEGAMSLKNYVNYVSMNQLREKEKEIRILAGEQIFSNVINKI